MATINQISDYVIFRSKAEGDADLSALKHQKLLYYIQAWHLAFNGTPAFEADFQAWIHGPVNREIYELYKDKKYLAERVGMVKDIRAFLSAELKKLGFSLVPSETNFVFAAPPDGDGRRLFDYLRGKKIFVRYFPGEATGS